MLYLLYRYSHESFSPLNVLQYITFRSAGALITALVISFLVSIPIIKKLRSYKVCQQIRTDGPQTHLIKAGTPTMGGIIILISMVTSTLLWARLDNRFVIVALIGTLYLGFIGWLDDYLKLVKRNPKGLSVRKKLIGQILFATALALYLYFFPGNETYRTAITIPYFKQMFLDIGVWYILFMMIVVVGSSNAVNLTDGLDGLAIGSIIFTALTYMVLAYVAGHVKFSEYLKIVHIPGGGELVVFLATLVGAGLGFLWYNAYPAEVFMGDTGSLFLGGVLGIIAVIIKQELLLVVAGGIFVMEALSVMLQVFSFKTRQKRIFKMAPLHHHFELSGWQESKVTIRFWIIAIMLALVALSALKVR